MCYVKNVMIKMDVEAPAKGRISRGLKVKVPPILEVGRRMV
jgi:hypothetical protein